jgi:DNA ligase (NAD+)
LHFKNIDNLGKASYEELITAEEIGDRIAKSIIEYFEGEVHQQEIEKLKAQGLQFVAEEKKWCWPAINYAGLSFIISGTFEKFSRDELKDIIEQNGGKILAVYRPS